LAHYVVKYAENVDISTFGLFSTSTKHIRQLPAIDSRSW